MTGIKPKDWKRDGWIAVCEEHIQDFKTEDDGYADVYGDMDDTCIMKGCENKADFEVYPNLATELDELKILKSSEDIREAFKEVWNENSEEINRKTIGIDIAFSDIEDMVIKKLR